MFWPCELATCERGAIPAAAPSASASSLTDEKRRSGSRSSARENHASKDDGRPGTDWDGIGIGAVQIFTSRSPTDSPSNGSLPVMHLNAMTPSDQTSVR